MKIRIRIQGALMVAAGLTAALFSRHFLVTWKNERADTTFDMLGIGAILAGFLFRIIGRGYKEDVSASGRSLVTSGPYQLVRNPMYLGTLLIGIGIATVILNLWAGGVFVAVFLIIYVPQIKKEEVFLRGRFGREFEAYCKRTPRFFFPPHRLFTIPDCVPFRLSWVRKEATAVIIALALVSGIELIQDLRLFGKQALYNELMELSLAAFLGAVCIIAFLKLKNRKRR